MITHTNLSQWILGIEKTNMHSYERSSLCWDVNYYLLFGCWVMTHSHMTEVALIQS